MRQDLKQKLELHTLFWSAGNDRPLFGFCAASNHPAAGYALFGKEILTPDHINEQLYQAYKADYTFVSILPDWPGDFFYTPMPDCGIAWYEAIIGCPLHFSEGTRMAWAKKLGASPQEFVANCRLPIKDDDAWINALKFLLERRQADFQLDPIPLVLARGIIDILFAALPETTVVLGLALEPEAYSEIIQEIAGMMVVVIKEQLKTIQPFHGGYALRRGLWAPGSVCMTQEDGAGLLSPSIFRQTILPAQDSIWQHFDYNLFHAHSTSLGIMLDGLLASDKLQCIECMIDPNGPGLDQLLPMLRKIQAAGKSILVASSLAPDEIRWLRDSLNPAGLAFLISTDTPSVYTAVAQ